MMGGGPVGRSGRGVGSDSGDAAAGGFAPLFVDPVVRFALVRCDVGRFDRGLLIVMPLDLLP
jgi:hypothetical protein